MKSLPKYLPKTRLGNLVLVLLTWVLAYLLGSYTLGVGAWWGYIGTFLLIYVAIKLFVRTFRLKRHTH